MGEKPPVETPAPKTPRKAETARPDREPETKPEPDPEAAAPAQKYSAEQVAAAKQLAVDLGVVVKEDADSNVTTIDTAANRSWVNDSQMQQILVFPHLSSLTTEGTEITDALAPRIAEQKELTFLALRNTLVGDPGISQLTGLKQLKVIDLRVSPLVTDTAMQSLAKMTELRAVRLSGVNVTDKGIATLLALPRLTELDLRNCGKVTKAGIEQLAAKKSLRVLKVGGPDIDDAVLQIVAGMDNLTGLSLDNCNITDAGIARIGKLPLVDLTVYQCVSATDKGLEMLAGCGDLRQLTLRDVGAGGSALGLLPHPEKLVSLNMAQSRFTDGEAAHLAKMKNLESLNLSETAITDAVIDTLSRMTSLKQLTLTQTGISEEGMNRLRKTLTHCAIRAE